MASLFKKVKDKLRGMFLSGILVVVPLILTYVVLRFLFKSIDGILSPHLERVFGYTVPGLGIITTVLIILLTGFFTRSLVGGTLYKSGDRLLARLPIIRVVYLAAKRLIEAITLPHNHTFKQVVLIEYPRKGAYAMGFATTRIDLEQEFHDKTNLIGVFIPSTPAPVSGIVIFVPVDDVIPLDISVEEGLKLIVSGGIVSPPVVRRKENGAIEEAEVSYASGQSA